MANIDVATLAVIVVVASVCAVVVPIVCSVMGDIFVVPVATEKGRDGGLIFS